MTALEMPAKTSLKSLDGCPLCHSGNSRKWYDFNPIHVFECRDCSFQYLNPCLDGESMAASYETEESLSALNDFYEGYYDYGSLDKDSGTLREIKQCLNVLDSHYAGPKGGPKKLFEIGAGNGFFLAAAKQNGWDVSGVESSGKNADIAREKFSVSLTQGLFEDFDGKPESFDAVVMRDVLEHRYDPHAFLAQAAKLVKKGGLMLVAVPNVASLLQYLSKAIYFATGKRLSMGLRKVYLLEHTGYYDSRTLGELFRAEGLEPLKTFQASTDLAKFRLSASERFMAGCVLWAGKMLGLQNRLIIVGRKR